MNLLNTAKGIGSFLGTHGSGIGSALTGVAALGSLFGGSSGGSNVAQSAALMRYQMNLQKNYTKWLNENQYSQMRTGLENANYNPLLALGASPSDGSIGIANATNPESKTAQLMEVMSGLAQIENIKANTAQAQSGLLGKILGSKGIQDLKSLFGSGNGVGIAKNLAKKLINSITSNVAHPASESKESGSTILKGYVSNVANDYNGQPFKEIDMAPKDFPSGMLSYPY